MSGHSKWSNIKNKKAANDAAKGSVFTRMAKNIALAVKKGGSIADPAMNFALRLAVEKARSVNMPKENIDRAIDKGMGKGGSELVELTIEAFGPDSTMVVVELVTDNRNRSVAEIRTIIEKYGGRMGEQGSVMYLFDQVGIVRIVGNISDELELELIDVGMIDMEQDGENTVIYTRVDGMHEVITKLQAASFVTDGGIGYRPKTKIAVNDHEAVESFIEHVSAYDDVQEIYANI